jgi:hydroxymethylbilane synthase
MHNLRLGTRGSPLALWQANHVKSLLLNSDPELSVEITEINTEGDRDRISSLTAIGGEGVFTKAIESALLDGKVDMAIHSLKDLPSTMAEGLVLAGVPPRGPVADVLISAEGISLTDLPYKARIATGSTRRRTLLLHIRPDFEMCDLRGNIHTRIQQLSNRDIHAIVMAKAPLVRLQLFELPHYIFDVQEMIPSVGQGAIGIQIRATDRKAYDIVRRINHAPSFQEVIAERAFLRRLDTGCQFPVGANATVKDDTINLIGFVGDVNGQCLLIDKIKENVSRAKQAGEQLAANLINRGAFELLRQACQN